VIEHYLDCHPERSEGPGFLFASSLFPAAGEQLGPSPSLGMITLAADLHFHFCAEVHRIAFLLLAHVLRTLHCDRRAPCARFHAIGARLAREFRSTGGRVIASRGSSSQS
jgi:hypothetical protein